MVAAGVIENPWFRRGSLEAFRPCLAESRLPFISPTKIPESHCVQVTRQPFSQSAESEIDSSLELCWVGSCEKPTKRCDNLVVVSLEVDFEGDLWGGGT